MKRYFNTKEKAQKFLEIRRNRALKDIEKRGQTVIGDNSCVYQDYLWEKSTINLFGQGELSCMTQTNKLKWFTWLAIVTQEMVDDLMKMKTLGEIQDEEQRLINEISKTEIHKDIRERLRTTKKNIPNI
jgi:hypothetical protein